MDPRPVELEDGSEGVALRDPAAVVPDGVALSPAAWWLAAHLDGRRTADEVAAAARARGMEVSGADVAALAAELGRLGLLEGPAREALRRRALSAFRAGGVRAPSCAGDVYPGEPDALRRALDRWLAAPAGPAPAPRPLRLLVSPHIDFTRGAPAYAHAARALQGADAELYVVFGTAHASPPRLFTLTRLDYGTPLGPVRTDAAAVAALVGALGEDELLGDELAHRDEHSVELQVVLLAHRARRPFTVLPVLCSSISHLADPAAATAPFLRALAGAVAGRRVCYVAGADLAHLGPAYGDPRPPGAPELAAAAAEDRRTLRYLEAGDAEGFHRDAIRDDARRRLCGIAPIYAAMRASGRGARLLHHGQWTDGTDAVSFAAAAG